MAGDNTRDGSGTETCFDTKQKRKIVQIVKDRLAREKIAAQKRQKDAVAKAVAEVETRLRKELGKQRDTVPTEEHDVEPLTPDPNAEFAELQKARDETRATRKKDAILNAASLHRFFDVNEAAEIAAQEISWDDSEKAFVGRMPDGSLAPLVTYFENFATMRSYLVKK